MYIVVPVGEKMITVELFTFEDVRQISYIKDSTSSVLEYLNSKITTPNINKIEKFVALLKLFEVCNSSTIPLTNKEGEQFRVYVSNIYQNFEDLNNVREIININGYNITLDYPYNISATRSIDAIYSITIGEQEVILSEISQEEADNLISILPTNILPIITDYIERHTLDFKYTLIDNIKIEDSTVNILSIDLQHLLYNMFVSMSMSNFREQVFILSKRVSVDLIMKSTIIDIADYYKLYQTEIEQENNNTQQSQSLV